MPEKTPPTYRWAVSCGDAVASFVDAAYPVLDNGHMLLKDSDHKIVFAAGPDTKCTFTRTGPAASASEPEPLPVTVFPPGCVCTYTGNFGSLVTANRWHRNVNWGCSADHTEIDGNVVLAAASPPAADGRCPHGYPLTVRCHECTPITFAEAGTHP